MQKKPSNILKIGEQMTRTLLFILSIFIFNGCSSVKVTHDFDPAFSFDNVQTYAIVHKSQEHGNTLTDDRIKTGIDTQLRNKGYTKAGQKNANIYVLFHTNVQNKTKIIQDYQYVGITPYRYGLGYGYGGMMAVPVTRTYNYDEGKLIIDILDAKDKKIVWRGVATDSLKDHKTPEKRVEYINNVMTSIFQTLPSKNVTPK